jgi:putative transcriptional regulator
MKKELFDELIASIEEGGAIFRNEFKSSKKLNVKEIEVKKNREGTNLTQSQFAELLGISLGTIRNCE